MGAPQTGLIVRLGARPASEETLEIIRLFLDMASGIHTTQVSAIRGEGGETSCQLSSSGGECWFHCLND